MIARHAEGAVIAKWPGQDRPNVAMANNGRRG